MYWLFNHNEVLNLKIYITILNVNKLTSELWSYSQALILKFPRSWPQQNYRLECCSEHCALCNLQVTYWYNHIRLTVYYNSIGLMGIYYCLAAAVSNEITTFSNITRAEIEILETFDVSEYDYYKFLINSY